MAAMSGVSRSTKPRKGSKGAVAKGGLRASKAVNRSHAAAPMSAGAKAAAMEEVEAIACSVCGSGDDLPGNDILLCDGRNGQPCPNAYHLKCLPVPLSAVPSGDWLCPSCAAAEAEAQRDRLSRPFTETFQDIRHQQIVDQVDLGKWACEQSEALYPSLGSASDDAEASTMSEGVAVDGVSLAAGRMYLRRADAHTPQV